MCSLYGKPCPQKDDATESKSGKDACRRCNRHEYTRLLLHHVGTDENLNRPLLQPIHKDGRQRVLLIVTAAEDDRKKMLRTIDTFQGFLDCLENPTVKGIVYGLGVWHTGEIKGNPAMQEAYEMGKSI